MICQRCQQEPATVHVTDIAHTKTAPTLELKEQHLCEPCAQAGQVPHGQGLKKSVSEIWKMLQKSAARGRKEAQVSCGHCGTTLAEFRQRGRLGCPQCYTSFSAHLQDLLERIHGATRHVGRMPGLDEASVERIRRVTHLEQQLKTAIREEAYEDAARLRDELKALQGS